VNGSAENKNVIESKPGDFQCFPTDSRRYLGDGAEKHFGSTNYYSFVPFMGERCINAEALHIYDSIHYPDEFVFPLHWAVRSVIPDYDEYEDVSVQLDDIAKMLELWRLICDAPTFDEVFEALCGIDYTTSNVDNRSLLYFINNTATDVWNRRDSDRHMYENFQIWFDGLEDKYTHIEICGI
jgi:hypothetical protein